MNLTHYFDQDDVTVSWVMMVRAEITPVTDDCYDHPEDDFVRRCLCHIFSLSLLLLPDGHLVLV